MRSNRSYKPRGRRDDDEDNVVVFRRGRTIYFFDEVDEESVCEAIKFIDQIEEENNKKDISIRLNTGGGNCYDGLALYDRIRQSPCNVIITGTGLIASMGLIIFLAGDERKISENSRLLNHQISIEDFASNAVGFKIEQKEIDGLQTILTDIVSERTGQSVKKIANEILPGDKWITAQQAIENGYADELIKNTRTYRRKKNKGDK